MYGVSPQPEQAPENSNSGCSSCTSFTWLMESAARPVSGIFRKKSQLAASLSRSGGCATMLMALCFTSLLLLAGQTSTHSVQPVQSSGATCKVYLRSFMSFQRAATALKVTGAPASCFSSYTLARITLCGQTSTHLPHWMHNSSSHTGISSEMLRFSQRADPVGQVPSTGITLTGRLSPLPAIIGDCTTRKNVGAPAGTWPAPFLGAVISVGTFTSNKFAN